MNHEPNIPETPETPPAGKPAKAPGTGWFSRMGTAMSLWASAFVNHTGFRIFKIVVVAAVALMMVFYGAAMLFTQESAFTVKMTKDQDYAISLSETADFASPTTNLSMGGMPEMTNIDGLTIPGSVDDADGAHHGDNYMAYTFYVKNAGEETCNLISEFSIDHVVKGADAAIRVKMYRNGFATTYAKLGADGAPEYGTVPFANEDTVFTTAEEQNLVEPGEIIKYTFVIWLEGNDPECLDNIKGGRVNLSLTFTAEEPSQP